MRLWPLRLRDSFLIPDAALHHLPRPLHPAGHLACRLHRLPTNPLRPRRSHSANAGRRRRRRRHPGCKTRLRTGRPVRRTIPELLERRAPRRSRQVTALQPGSNNPDRKALSLFLLAVAGSRILLSGAAAAVAWSVLAVAAICVGGIFLRLTLKVHGIVFMLLALTASSALEQAAGLLLGERTARNSTRLNTRHLGTSHA